MSKLVTILSIPFPRQIHVVKARLESEGIECFTKNELTIQTDPLLSNALGGIQLQVKEEDVEAAVKILEEEGYLSKEEAEVNPYSGLEAFADKIPFFKRVRFEVRLGVLITLIITVISLLAYFIFRPSTIERLTANSWCIDHINFKGKDYRNRTTGMHVSIGGGCDENFYFNKNSDDIYLPGFNTPIIFAKWKYVDDSITFSHADTFQFVYNGRYSVEFSGKNLVLKSKTTTINCTSF